MKLEAKHFGPDRFYVPTHSQQQSGMYKLLIKKRGIAPEIVCECLDEYRAKYLQWLEPKDTDSNKSKKYWNERRIKNAVITYANNNFDKLLAIVTEKTGQTFKRNYKKSRRNSYDDWYAEASMDGSLAYSGVTEDF